MGKLDWKVTPGATGETHLTVRLDFDIPAGWIQFLAYAIVEGKVNYAWLLDQKLVKPGSLTFRRSQDVAIKWIKLQLAQKGNDLFEWYAPAFLEVATGSAGQLMLVDCESKYEDLEALVDKGWTIYGWADRFGDQLSYTRNAHSSVGGELP